MLVVLFSTISIQTQNPVMPLGNIRCGVLQPDPATPLAGLPR
jgi:hypothetical protein